MALCCTPREARPRGGSWTGHGVPVVVVGLAVQPALRASQACQHAKLSSSDAIPCRLQMSRRVRMLESSPDTQLRLHRALRHCAGFFSSSEAPQR